MKRWGLLTDETGTARIQGKVKENVKLYKKTTKWRKQLYTKDRLVRRENEIKRNYAVPQALRIDTTEQGKLRSAMETLQELNIKVEFKCY